MRNQFCLIVYILSITVFNIPMNGAMQPVFQEKKIRWEEECDGIDEVLLARAVKGNDSQRVKKIIEEQPYVIGDITYPLFNAVEQCYLSLEAVDTLIKQGKEDPGTIMWKKRGDTHVIHHVHTVQMAQLLMSYVVPTCQKKYINIPDNKGKTPLWYALFKHNNKELGAYYISLGADVNAQTHKGDTVLHKAIYKIQPDIAHLLLHHNADVCKQDNAGESPVYLLFDSQLTDWTLNSLRDCFEQYGVTFFQKKKGNIIATLRNAQQKFDKNNTTKQERLELLKTCGRLFACLLRYDENKRLQQEGITINSKGYLFNNASCDDLSALVGQEALDFVNRIMTKKSAKNEMNTKILTHRMLARVRKHPFLLHCWKGLSAFNILRGVIKKGKYEAFNTIMSYNPPLDWTGRPTEDNILHESVEISANKPDLNNQLIIKELLSHGCNFAHRNWDGITPLEMAQKEKCDSWITAFNNNLIRYFVNVSEMTPWRKDAEEFLKTKVDINMCDDSGQTMLFTAIGEKNMNWVLFLLQHGAHVNIQDVNGETPLAYAIFHIGNFDVIPLLLEYGAVVTDDMFSKPWHKCLYPGAAGFKNISGKHEAMVVWRAYQQQQERK